MTTIDVLEKLRVLFAGGRRPGAADTLARRINCTLMVFEDQLCDLASGQRITLSDTSDEPGFAENIAAAAEKLLGDQNTESKCIQLLLPPSEFLAQPVSLPGLAKADIRAAMHLQKATRLPEQEQPLELSLSFDPVNGLDSHAIAWWLPADKANQLFDAMAAKSLFMAAILPRPAWLLETCFAVGQSATRVIMDCDDTMYTVIGHTVIGQVTSASAQDEDKALACLQTSVKDLEDTEIAALWQTELIKSGLSQPDLRLESLDDYLRFMRGHSLPVAHPDVSQGAVFPQAALAARHQLDRGKRRTQLTRAAAAVVAILMLPLLYQSWQLSSLGAELESLRQLSAEPRANQSVVRDFESQWGILTEFPDQDVIAVLLALQEVINPGVLSAFSIDEGLISIEGESEDPQNVLEMLEQNPLFTEVDFARATNNNRYFIDLRLATVNFPAYHEWHFPGQR